LAKESQQKQMKEQKIISNFYPLEPQQDDCYWDPSAKILVTTDSLAEKTHFLHEWSTPESIADKLVEVNVSDILSSGGVTTKAFLNLGLSSYSSQDSWIRKFTQRFQQKLAEHRIELCGGDTFFSETTHLTLTLLGKLPKKQTPITRKSQFPNSFLYLSGEIGFSQLGYQILRKEFSESPFSISSFPSYTSLFRSISRKTSIPISIIQKAIFTHLCPQSEVRLKSQIQKFRSHIHAMMDVTDGIVQDSEKLANASRVGLEIDVELIPGFKELSSYLTVSDFLNSGEELRLLFLGDEKIPPTLGIPIGRTNSSLKKVIFRYQGKKIFPQKGFLHF
jgi:thiamine-monophosphate kinase